MIRRKIGSARISRRELLPPRRISLDLIGIHLALKEFIESELSGLVRLLPRDVPNGTIHACASLLSYVLREAVRAYTGIGAATLSIERSREKELSFVLDLCEMPDPERFALAIAVSEEAGYSIEFIDNKIILKTEFYPKTKLTIRSRDKRLLQNELMMTFFV